MRGSHHVPFALSLSNGHPHSCTALRSVSTTGLRSTSRSPHHPAASASKAPATPPAGPEVGEAFPIDDANGAKAQIVFRDPAGNERWALITGAGECLERHHPDRQSVEHRARLLAQARRI